MVAKLI